MSLKINYEQGGKVLDPLFSTLCENYEYVRYVLQTEPLTDTCTQTK